MSSQTPQREHLMAAVENLSRFHREHEKYYAEAPLHDAIALQRMSRTLMALAERWSIADPAEHPVAAPFAGATDLNDERAIETSGVLFMEGDAPPAEIASMCREIDRMAGAFDGSGKWLAGAMQGAWAAAEALVDHPELADLLGERHRIISNDWLNASLASLVARHLERAALLLRRVDFTPAGVRADMAGQRTYPDYLYSVCELLDRAADLTAESATVVHDNERRWRVFLGRVAEIERGEAA